MADLGQLKQKYSGVISTIEGFSDLGAIVTWVVRLISGNRTANL